MLAYKVVKKQNDKLVSAVKGGLKCSTHTCTYPLPGTAIFCFKSLDFEKDFIRWQVATKSRYHEIWSCDIESTKITDIEDILGAYRLPWSLLTIGCDLSFADIDGEMVKGYHVIHQPIAQNSYIDIHGTIFADSCILLEKIEYDCL